MTSNSPRVITELDRLGKIKFTTLTIIIIKKLIKADYGQINEIVFVVAFISYTCSFATHDRFISI